MPDLTDAIAAAHAALDERFYPGPTDEMVACIVEAAAPVIATKAWEEGARVAWDRSTPVVNGQNYYWRHEGEPVNPYRADALEAGPPNTEQAHICCSDHSRVRNT